MKRGVTAVIAVEYSQAANKQKEYKFLFVALHCINNSLKEWQAA
jgi:hypothetical protein